jgi:hypothetical protein
MLPKWYTNMKNDEWMLHKINRMGSRCRNRGGTDKKIIKKSQKIKFEGGVP